MRTKHYPYIGLGICWVAIACREPPQFRELTVGEHVYVGSTAENPAQDHNEPTGTAKQGNPDVDILTNPGAPTPSPMPGNNNDETNNSGKDDNETGEDTDVNQSDGPKPPLFTDCEESPEKSIVADLYELPTETSHIPDFQTMDALRTVCVKNLDIANRAFSEGFPGVEDLYEWFALDMRFQVNVPKNGTYKFSLAADDGAILWIDDNKVIDNDGLHPVQTLSSSVYLAAGKHTFRVAYFQGPRWHIALELFWQIPGSNSRTYIPDSAISRLEQ